MNKYITKGFILTLASLLMAAISFLREMVFANYFGVSEISDAYTVAIQLPEVLFTAVWTGINAVLIPMYHRVKEQDGTKAASNFLSKFFTAILLITVVTTCFGELLASTFVYVFAPGFSAEAHNLAAGILRWVFPMVIFEGTIRVCSAVFQINQNFTVPKILGGIRNIGVITFLILFSTKFGVLAAAVGLLTGIIIECFLAFFTSRRYEHIGFMLDAKDAHIRTAGAQAVPVIIGAGVSELNQLADKIIASFLVSGSVVSLQYASKMEGIISTVFLYNIVILAFPTLSESVAKKETKKVEYVFNSTVKLIVLLIIPLIVGGFILGEDLITILFMRGKFDQSAVKMVSPLFSLYLLAALFITIRNATVNVFAAYGKTKKIMINTIISVVTNIALNVLFSYFFESVGIVIATCISSFIVLIPLLIDVNRLFFRVHYKEIFLLMLKTLISASFMGIVVIAVKFAGNFVFKAQISTLINILICSFGIVIGAGVYLLAHIVLKTDVVRELIVRIKDRSARKSEK